MKRLYYFDIYSSKSRKSIKINNLIVSAYDLKQAKKEANKKWKRMSRDSGYNNLFPKNASIRNIIKFKIFSGGLVYSPSGVVKETTYWSDGSTTEEWRKCSPMPIYNNLEIT